MVVPALFGRLKGGFTGIEALLRGGHFAGGGCAGGLEPGESIQIVAGLIAVDAVAGDFRGRSLSFLQASVVSRSVQRCLG